jgi:hypothetical protein
MNELQLREFRTRAEELVDLPDLAELESRGRRLRQRRVALGAGLAAAVLAVTGGLVAANQRDDGDSTPVEPPDDRAPAEVVEYPGPVMEILDSGTYVMQPSVESDAPLVRLTIPAGWNAWHGPNRFDGDLETTGWYTGLLVLDVDAVASRPCLAPQSDDVVGDSRAELVDALRGLPGARVRVERAPDAMFGHPATYLQLQFPVPGPRCQAEVNVLTTARHGIVAGTDESLRDVWVVDVDGNAILIAAGYDDPTPHYIRRQLYEMVDSIEFVDPE